MRRTVVYLIAAAITLVGCGKESSEKTAERLKDKGAMDVVRQAADDKYDPPADGKLTDAQVQMYLKVREREVEIAKVARQQLEQQAAKVKEKGDRSIGGLMEAYKGLGTAANFLTADIRAAQELGFNTAEYMWVKGQVIKASAAEYMEKSQAQLAAVTDQAYENMKKQYETTTDETTKQALKGMLDQMEKSRAEISADKMGVDDTDRFNRDLLAKYEDSLKALATEATKWGTEQKDADQLTDDLRTNLERTTTADQEPQ
jgi:hypothetical protein